MATPLSRVNRASNLAGISIKRSRNTWSSKNFFRRTEFAGFTKVLNGFGLGSVLAITQLDSPPRVRIKMRKKIIQNPVYSIHYTDKYYHARHLKGARNTRMEMSRLDSYGTLRDSKVDKEAFWPVKLGS